MNNEQQQYIIVLAAIFWVALTASVLYMYLKHRRLERDRLRSSCETTYKHYEEDPWARYHQLVERRPGYRNWRAWLSLGDVDYRKKGLELQWEVPVGKNVKHWGFKLHLGDQYSETPVDFHVGLWRIAFFISVNFPGLGKFCGWLGRGHKRDVALKFHDGSMWWKLWHDADMGTDRGVHRCDKWRQPSWWWPFKSKKYRSWMCLRDGNIPLNPISAIWGSPIYQYTTLDKDTLLIEIDQFLGDEYMVDFKVQAVYKGRLKGAKWVQRKKFQYFEADWNCDDGIPIQNHSWKGNNMYGSSVKVPDPFDWRLDADDNLKAWVKKERERNGYQPPVSKVTHIEDREDGIYVNGVIFDQKIADSIVEGVRNAGSINIGPLTEAAKNAAMSFSSFKSAFPDNETSEKNDMILTGFVPQEGLDIAANEELKSKFTPEELAKQAVFRDQQAAIYTDEANRAGRIIRKNRYDTVTGEWIGPDPEPGKEE